MTDLMELALENLAREQNNARRQLVSRAPEFVAMHATLDALHAAGLLLVVRDVALLPVTLPAERTQVMITADAAADARGLAAHRLADARFEVVANAPFKQTSVWRHPNGWLLIISWLGSHADVCTPPAQPAPQPCSV